VHADHLREPALQHLGARAGRVIGITGKNYNNTAVLQVRQPPLDRRCLNLPAIGVLVLRIWRLNYKKYP